MVCAGLDRFRVGERTHAAPRWRSLRTQIGVGREYSVEPGQVRLRRWRQRRQLCDKVHRIPFDMVPFRSGVFSP